MVTWLDKILKFKESCKAGNIMTEAQARILRSVLYDYEIVHSPLQDSMRGMDTIKREVIENNNTITIDRTEAQAIIDLLTSKLK